MAASTEGVRASVAGVRGSTVAEANARDHKPAAASTAPRASTDGAVLLALAWDIRASTTRSVAEARLLDGAEGPNSHYTTPVTRSTRRARSADAPLSCHAELSLDGLPPLGGWSKNQPQIRIAA